MTSPIEIRATPQARAVALTWITALVDFAQASEDPAETPTTEGLSAAGDSLVEYIGSPADPTRLLEILAALAETSVFAVRCLAVAADGSPVDAQRLVADQFRATRSVA